MMNEKCKIKTSVKIYIWLIIIFLWYLNIHIALELDNQLKVWKRFTYEDWLALYNSCSLKPWPKTKKLIEIYWDKQTDFKNYLLLKYENN